MRQEIRLFISGAEIEFSQPPQILYNYTETDLRKPTAVKNSFSKSINIEGTQTNNAIFGHIWRLDRNQLGGGLNGASFNPMLKADFELYNNGELYEKGYCRLNDITRNGNDVSYNITLYGGLGSLLQELSYGNSDSDTKKTIADLNFGVDLGFTINKETIDTAWQELSGEIDKEYRFNAINFAVTSEGIPSDFSADKVLVNLNGGPKDFKTNDDGYKGLYGGVAAENGFTLATAATDLTMDTSFDLRSYLLRPVLSVRSVFEAIQRPENNGGYDIRLDDHFFNYDNPYYFNAWVTLPKLRELGIEKVNNTDSSAISMTKETNNLWKIGNTIQGNNFTFTTQIKYTPSSTVGVDELHPAIYMKTTASGHNWSNYVKDFQTSLGICVRAIAYNALGEEVGHSEPIMLCGKSHSVPNKLWQLSKIPSSAQKKAYGSFKKIGNEWLWCDENGNLKSFDFSLPQNISFSSIKLAITFPWVEYVTYTKGWPVDNKSSEAANNYTRDIPMYTTTDERNISGLFTLSEIEKRNRVTGTISPKAVSISVATLDFESGFSGVYIPQDKLLKTDYSPADFLLSYCKLFGLYIYKDPVEESYEPLKYPNGVVHIVDRHTFYNDEFIDISSIIDYSKPITINPVTSNVKWYSYSYADGNGEADEKYRNSYGYNYGRQLVNTGLAFNNDTTELYDGSVFKNGVMVREKDVYFQSQKEGIPAYAFDGLTYVLYKGEDEKEEAYTRARAYNGDINVEGLAYYDSIPKLQVHSGENKEEDGNGILLFYNGMQSVGATYRITDDLPDMASLNDGEPCWLLTTSDYDKEGNTIAISKNRLPFFTRDIYQGEQSGAVVHSWNFGHPNETYVPNTFTVDYDSIYDKCWKDYMKDLYDVNTKTVTAYVRLGGKPNPVWLRRWYWFENAIWRINSIKDWNVGSYDTTEVEFIKIQDIKNYDVEKISSVGRIEIVLDSYVIGADGGTITGRVINQGGYSWTFADVICWDDAAGNRECFEDYVTPMRGSDEVTEFTLTIPANSGSERTYTLSVEDSQDNWHRVTFTQEGDTTPVLNVNPATAVITATDTGYTYTFTSANVRSGSYSVRVAESWASAVVNEGNKTIVVTATQNPSENTRSNVFYLSATGTDGSTVSLPFVLRQSGVSLTAYPLSLTFDFDSTSAQQLTITTDGNWTASIE